MNDTQLESITLNGVKIEKGTELYHARIIPTVGVCYVQTITIRTIYEDVIIGLDKLTKICQVINTSHIGVDVFTVKKHADKLVKETQQSGKIRTLEKEKDDNE